MKPLIAVCTCHRSNGPQAQRQTWAKESSIDVRFFYGRGGKQLLADEVLLDVPDDYVSLPYKVQEAVRWARRNGYTHFFKCDDDLYIRPERLRNSGFEKFYYSGKHMYHSMCGDHPYCHGGAGYWLNTTAMDIISKAPIDCISEDGWVANTLIKKNIKAHNDERYVYTRRVYKDPYPTIPLIDNDVISSAEFTPEEMTRVHNSWIRSKDGSDVIEKMSGDEYKKYLKLCATQS